MTPEPLSDYARFKALPAEDRDALGFARWQEQHHRGPQTHEEIAAYLRDLSRRMLACGTAMDYYGGFDGRMSARGLEMVGAARLAHDWAQEIEAGVQNGNASDA